MSRIGGRPYRLLHNNQSLGALSVHAIYLRR